ncbi:hypothetical protein B0T22DRAFT_444754 [Podospora appendiculata]|uniref:Uncharacterized protein n=1 Tax=Podospora appendiculata TaxID=314037 RepID=A0AAE1C8B1_9PEZI|nr:hypothetical protein B0T22DRAFT_444754 [Podospora appendiculata]
MEARMHNVKLEEQPEEPPYQYSCQTTPHSSIRLQAISFPGTPLGTTTVPNLTVPASINPSGHQNSVPATLLQHLTNMETNKIHKWAESGSVHIVLDWRLDEKPHPVFRTRHLLTSDDAQPDSSEVVFAGNLDWAQNLAEHIHAVSRARELATAAHLTQPQPRSRLAACCGNSSRGCSQCIRRRARSVRLVLEEQIAVEPEVDRCGGGGSSIHDTKKRQCSQKLVERHRSYAEEIFRTTGDTSELLQTTSLSQRMLGSQPPTQQQQPRCLLIRGGGINKPGCWNPPHRMWRSSP